MITHASIERRLRAIEQKINAKKNCARGFDLYFVPKGCVDPKAFSAECGAISELKGNSCFVIEFVGPEGEPEEGTGPFQEDE